MATIDTNEAHAALSKIVYDAGIISNIAFPNVAIDAALPRVEINFGEGERRGGTLGGAASVLRARGALYIVIAVEADSGIVAADDYADQFATLFTEGDRISLTGATLTIMSPADIRPGFMAEKEWRIPVIVRYEIVTT